jgi:hypothetical protein
MSSPIVQKFLDTDPTDALECRIVSRNQHRWENWVEDDRIRAVLKDAAKGLAWAWKLDRKSPRSYPVNTWFLFVQIEELLKSESGMQTVKKPLPAPRVPQRLSDLVKERTIKAAYEDHNEGSYENALRQAAQGYDEGHSAWRKIMRAVDVAYLISHYGIESAPKPKVQFLHRKLLEIVESEHLGGMKLGAIVEFFDDVCPCRKNHKPDAIRKLTKRWAKVAKRPYDSASTE